MIGLIALAAVVVWIGIAAGVSVFATRLIKRVVLRWTVAVLLFLLLVPMPVIDEIAGKQQFEHLCREHSSVWVDHSTPRGTRVYFNATKPQLIARFPLRIQSQSVEYLNASSGVPVVRYAFLRATGGFLVRFLGFPEGKMPILFRGSCFPPNEPIEKEGIKALGFELIDNQRGQAPIKGVRLN